VNARVSAAVSGSGRSVAAVSGFVITEAAVSGFVSSKTAVSGSGRSEAAVSGSLIIALVSVLGGLVPVCDKRDADGRPGDPDLPDLARNSGCRLMAAEPRIRRPGGRRHRCISG
jgi:hypothetical protein